MMRPPTYLPACGAALAAIAWLAAQAPVAAQAPAAQAPAAPPATPPYSFQLTGGVVAPIGEARDAAGLGWNVSVGAEIRLREPVALRAQYLYARFADVPADLPLPSIPGGLVIADLRAKLQSHTGFFDVVVRRSSSDGRRTGYLLAGPLVALRRVKITGEGEGSFDACLPQWLQCEPAPVPFDQALGVRRATSLGASVGAGVAFDVGLRARLVVEARYMYLDGPAFTAADGTTRRASASYLPLTVGLRF